jgi:osmotically-inducible protein OsmY
MTCAGKTITLATTRAPRAKETTMTSQKRIPTHPSRTIITTLAAATLAAAVLAGCASTPIQESAGEYLDSSVITAKVKLALLNAENLPSGQISVASFKRGVQLSGFVPTATDKSRAEVIARDIDGVRAVTNSIQVKGQ